MSTLTIAGHGSCTAIVGGTNTLNVPTYVPAVGDMVLVRCNQTVTATGTGAFFDFYVNAAGTGSGGFNYIGLASTPAGAVLVFYKVLTASDIAAMGATAGALTLGITNVGGTTTAVGTAAAIVVSGFTGIAGATFDIAQQGVNMATAAATVTFSLPQFQTTYSNLIAGPAEAVLLAGWWNGTWATGAGNLPTGTINGVAATFYDDLSASTPRVSCWGWATAAPNVGGGNSATINWTTATRKAGFYAISIYDSNNVAGSLNGASVSLSASATPTVFNPSGFPVGSLQLSGNASPLGFTSGDLELSGTARPSFLGLGGSASTQISLLAGGAGGMVGTQGWGGSASGSISLLAKATPLLYKDYNAVPARAVIPFRPAAPLDGVILTASASISLLAAGPPPTSSATGALSLAASGPAPSATAAGAVALSGLLSGLGFAAGSIVLIGFVQTNGGPGFLTLLAKGPLATTSAAGDLEVAAGLAPLIGATGSIVLAAAGPLPSATASGSLSLTTYAYSNPFPMVLALQARSLSGTNNPSAADLEISGSGYPQGGGAASMMLLSSGPRASAAAPADLEILGVRPSAAANPMDIELSAIISGASHEVIGTDFFQAATRVWRFAAAGPEGV